MDAQHKAREPKITTYITGFLFSVMVTLVAYYATTQHVFSRNVLITYIIGLALIQFAVQVIFFLHLGEDAKPRIKIMTFSFMLLVVAILVLGSLWIMNNLNYRMMPDNQHVNQYLDSQDGL